ncbi:hypothetical protein FA13DRAFT_1714418 [Coprinellus micaceus]|uniref:Uncharacterized protein n=1 Tax=Coprinellus micaceus TaxID=71717 RepID=A0A4Y7SSB4_COPMI|nr:hypothetical protein FA13DRAFT_1714418 [Coprinellus micaceus]
MPFVLQTIAPNTLRGGIFALSPDHSYLALAEAACMQLPTDPLTWRGSRAPTESPPSVSNKYHSMVTLLHSRTRWVSPGESVGVGHTVSIWSMHDINEGGYGYNYELCIEGSTRYDLDEVSKVLFLDNGKRILIAPFGPGVRIFDITTGREDRLDYLSDTEDICWRAVDSTETYLACLSARGLGLSFALRTLAFAHSEEVVIHSNAKTIKIFNLADLHYGENEFIEALETCLKTEVERTHEDLDVSPWVGIWRHHMHGVKLELTGPDFSRARTG